MAHDKQIQALARRYYVFERFTLEQSAEKAGISFATIRRWKNEAKKNGDDWEQARDVQVMASGEIDEISKGLLVGFIIQYKNTIKEVENSNELTAGDKVKLLSSLSDSFSKMTASSKKLIPEVSELATAMKVMEMFGSLVKKNKPHLLIEFLEILEELEQVIKQEFEK